MISQKGVLIDTGKHEHSREETHGPNEVKGNIVVHLVHYLQFIVQGKL